MPAANLTGKHPRNAQACTCQIGKITHKLSKVKKLRQNVISNARAASKWRVTTPAVDHNKATTIIQTTACP
jgi:hypothetical protein